MDTAKLVDNPELILDVPEHDLELVAREVVEHVIKASYKKSGKMKGKGSEKAADSLMVFVGSIHHRSPVFSYAVVLAFAGMGGNVNALIKSATRRKNDAGCRGFLDHLRAHLNPNYSGTYEAQRERRRRVCMPATERSCAWQGMNAAETRQAVECYR